MGDPKSNNSQHGLSAQQAADLVRGSYAAYWATAHHGTEIRGRGSARPDGDALRALPNARARWYGTVQLLVPGETVKLVR